MIGVMGAGAFGTALAVALSANGPIRLLARDADHAAAMQANRKNASRLPGITLPDTLMATAEAAALRDCDTILLAVPTQTLRANLTLHASLLSGKTLVVCCKGVELGTEASPTRIIAGTVADAVPAVLTGPSFAADIARGLPTALTLACADQATGTALQQALSTPTLRLYRTTDVAGAELGGALKNVIAIACGAVIGAGLGESARAALMTRGFAEMSRMATAMGALPETLVGLSGFGDLALTCTSRQSRNLRYGLSLGRGEAFDDTITVEGVATARATLARARTLEIDMPVTAAVAALAVGELRVDQAMDMLLSRPLKEE